MRELNKKFVGNISINHNGIQISTTQFDLFHQNAHKVKAIRLLALSSKMLVVENLSKEYIVLCEPHHLKVQDVAEQTLLLNYFRSATRLFDVGPILFS